tara:strand:- start:21210 stop:21572 length:363 start_codon:yes stop_codon:yes gene_type:complete
MEKGQILILASIIIIYIPTFFIGLPKAFKLAKVARREEHEKWLAAANTGGLWVGEQNNPGAQVLISSEQCFHRSEVYRKGLSFKDGLAIIWRAITKAITLQAVLVAGWFFIEIVINPVTR